jgi:hypothetical protein
MKTKEQIFEEYIGNGQMGIDFEKRHILEAMEEYSQQFNLSKEICNKVELYIQNNESYRSAIGMGYFAERFDELIRSELSPQPEQIKQPTPLIKKSEDNLNKSEQEYKLGSIDYQKGFKDGFEIAIAGKSPQPEQKDKPAKDEIAKTETDTGKLIDMPDCAICKNWQSPPSPAEMTEEKIKKIACEFNYDPHEYPIFIHGAKWALSQQPKREVSDEEIEKISSIFWGKDSFTALKYANQAWQEGARWMRNRLTGETKNNEL